MNKEIFLKATSLPIKVQVEPYFSNYLTILEKEFQAQTKFNEFVKLNEQIKNFDEVYYKTRNEIIQHITEKKEYDEFNALNLETYKINAPKSDNLYIANNHNGIFISLDLVKANFQALKFINPLIVDNCSTYYDFISQFTDVEFIKTSKYLRQYIFGNLNPKRMITIESYIINQVKTLSSYKELECDWELLYQNKDELLLKLKENATLNTDNVKTLINNVVNEMKQTFGIDLHGSLFQLDMYQFKTQLDAIYKVFVKNYLTENKREYKNVPLMYFMQIYKQLNKLPLNDDDLLFVNEKELCRTVKPLTLI